MGGRGGHRRLGKIQSQPLRRAVFFTYRRGLSMEEAATDGR